MLPGNLVETIPTEFGTISDDIRSQLPVSIRPQYERLWRDRTISRGSDHSKVVAPISWSAIICEIGHRNFCLSSCSGVLVPFLSGGTFCQVDSGMFGLSDCRTTARRIQSKPLRYVAGFETGAKLCHDRRKDEFRMAQPLDACGDPVDEGVKVLFLSALFVQEEKFDA